MLPKVVVYTDGASSGKSDSPGGWACIMIFGEHEKALTGNNPKTTNQRMEMTAAIRGLQALTRPCKVEVVSDSAYLVNCMQQHWYRKWKKNGWKNAKNKPVSNRDLWEELLEAVSRHEVTFAHVRGHNGHTYNERCDELAVEAKKQAPTVKKGRCPKCGGDFAGGYRGCQCASGYDHGAYIGSQEYERDRIKARA